VEVDVDSDFPKEREIIGINGGVTKVGIEYPWLPIKCKKCNTFGHATHTCTKIEKAVWLPRRKEPAQTGPVPKVQARAAPKVLPKSGGNDKPGSSSADQLTVVSRFKRTPKSRNTAVDNSKHWTNSFQLLAQAKGKKYDDSEIRKSNEALQLLLDEEMDRTPSCPVDKGKGKLEEEE
jgi:hypothetical protein